MNTLHKSGWKSEDGWDVTVEVGETTLTEERSEGTRVISVYATFAELTPNETRRLITNLQEAITIAESKEARFSE